MATARAVTVPTTTKATPYALGQVAGAVIGAIVGGRTGTVIAQGTQFGLGTAFLRYSREYEKAIEQCSKTLELDSTFILAHIFLGQAHEQLGAFPKAIAAFAKAVELSHRHPVYLADLGHGLAVAGRRADALSILDELNDISSQRYVAARAIAAAAFHPRVCNR